MKVLQFSGGLDSLACLFLLRPEWDKLTVVWCNTGSAYPETIEFIKKIADLVPNLMVVHSDKQAWEEQHGIGVAVVPENSTLFSAVLRGTTGQRYSSYLSCCAHNIWLPMHRFCLGLGATEIVRGQRKNDKYKAPIESGHQQDGIVYTFPIELWTREMVREYCERECPELIPEYYNNKGEDSSHDCWDCIGYLEHNKSRIDNLPHKQKEIVLRRIRAYNTVLELESSPLKEMIHANL